MAALWSDTASEIIHGAMEICGAVGVDETVQPEDSDLCLRALNGILKEMPIHGFSWPKVSTVDTAIAWSALTPSVVAVPSDYFGLPVLKFTDAGGKLIQLRRMTKPEYDSVDQAATATHPTGFHVGKSNAVYLWPIPTQDPGLKLTYQSNAGTVTLTDVPGLDDAFIPAMQFWLADEVSLKFQVPQGDRVEIAQRAKGKRDRLLSWATELSPISVTVAD